MIALRMKQEKLTRLGGVFLCWLVGFGFALTALAQEPLALSEKCTVTVGNQTAFVRPDGSFFLRNISVFRSRDTGIAPQLYRVRATCLCDGEMVTGQSNFFALTPSETAFITDIFPSALDPIPIRITADATADVVPLGETVQLLVTAIKPDGSDEDVTERAQGTTYLSTNPRLLTVAENGQVTGTNTSSSPQTAAIAILNEGNITTISFLSVGESNDFDNDGMPNDYEELFGLNPLANDAGGDLDNDGLSNFVEFELGTLPNNPDTDLDGVIDGLDGDPLHPDEAAPTVLLSSPTDGDVLLEGQILQIVAAASDDGLVTQIELFLNGQSMEVVLDPPKDDAFLAHFSLTIPYDPTGGTLAIRVEATDSLGAVGTESRTVSVIPDPLTDVVGLVLDPDGQPVEGAEVALQLSGLVGEFFDFSENLGDFPDLSGLSPDAVKFIADLNFKNPDQVLSPDTFGLGFAPNFAARFTGLLAVSSPGSFTFHVVAAKAARLSMDGEPLLEASGPEPLNQAETQVFLEAGIHAVEIEYFQTNQSAELQVTFGAEFGLDQVEAHSKPHASGPGRPRGAIALPIFASRFQLPDDLLVGISGPNGSFEFPGVPANLGPIKGKATAELEGTMLEGFSESVPPSPGQLTDLGEIQLQKPGILILHSDPTLAPTVKDVLAETGLFLPEQIEFREPFNETLEELTQFSAILVYSDFPFEDPSGLGDLLADYVDQDGGLVLATYALNPPWNLAGRIFDPGYSPFQTSQQLFTTSGELDLANSDSSHPILANVNSATYFVNLNYTDPPLSEGATLIAVDTNGNKLIAVNQTNSIVGISIFPGLVQAIGRGETALIFANALNFVR